MSKKRNTNRKRRGDEAASHREDDDSRQPHLIDAAPSGWSLRAKFVVSALLTVHVVAVVIFPLAFAANQASPSVMLIANTLRPYGEVLYLDHGYFFFAPNPGPSHLVDYRLEFDDGRPAIEGRFPDLKAHWPRLWYHRHFMLAEHLNAGFISPVPPETTDRAVLEAWRRDRSRYERHLRAFQNHLLDAHGADRVSLVRVEHMMLFPDEFEQAQREHIRLDDERSFVPLDEPILYSRRDETRGDDVP